MAKKKEDKIDFTIKHPEPDTTPNEGKEGEPPPTWDPGKVTQPPPPPSEEEE
jgi:hypothetical protein